MPVSYIENFQYLQARRRRRSSIYVEGFLISSNKPRINKLTFNILIGLSSLFTDLFNFFFTNLPTISQNSSNDVHGSNSSRYEESTRSEAFNIASSLCLMYSAKTEGHWSSDKTFTFCNYLEKKKNI